jgi:hypothetical protein
MSSGGRYGRKGEVGFMGVGGRKGAIGGEVLLLDLINKK